MSSIAELCHALPKREFASGAVLLAEGETSGDLFVLSDGHVEILKGDLQLHVVSDRGAVFGEISALLGVPNVATIRAVAHSQVHVVTGGADYIRTHPDVAYSLLRLFAQRLYGVTGYMGDVRRQFEDHDSHLAMIHDLVTTLVHHPEQAFTPGSDRDPGV